MQEPFRPTDGDALLDIVRGAIGEQKPLEIVGHGSKRSIGRPLRGVAELDLGGLSGITLYEPEELVLSARAGTPISDIRTALDDAGQELAFEPMDYCGLLGGEPGSGTLGGVVATNLSGPRRIKVGAARDHTLGLKAVTGRGEKFNTGGRVVKNVTGYDLSKGLAGSWGTLAVLTDVTVKVMPKAQTEKTLIIRGLDNQRACAVLCAAMGSAADVSGAAHFPERPAARLRSQTLNIVAGAVTVLRLEGIAASVDYRVNLLADKLSKWGPADILDGAGSRELWIDIRDVRPFAQGDPRVVWRLSVAPMSGHQVVEALAHLPGIEAYFDWAGGLIWLALEPDNDAGAAPIRAAVARAGGGHATVIRAAPSIRARIPVFEPQQPALAGLTARIKENFDPAGVLNPGRMYAGV
jgi:glycolate oxidase FAD binding subunit